eukprot:134039-Alexandrium_andersonii.AAC.1
MGFPCPTAPESLKREARKPSWMTRRPLSPLIPSIKSPLQNTKSCVKRGLARIASLTSVP